MEKEAEFKESMMNYIQELITDEHVEKSAAMIEAIASLVGSLARLNG